MLKKDVKPIPMNQLAQNIDLEHLKCVLAKKTNNIYESKTGSFPI